MPGVAKPRVGGHRTRVTRPGAHGTGHSLGRDLHRADLLAHGGDEPLAPFTPAAVFTDAQPLSLPTLLVSSRGAVPLGSDPNAGPGRPLARGRTAVFLIGLALIASVTVSGLEAYDTALLSVHMVQHMVLSMLAPIFLALGAPVTLALRTLKRRPRRALLAVLHSRVAKVFTFPLVSFRLFIASPFVLYFSGLYRLSL